VAVGDSLASQFWQNRAAGVWREGAAGRLFGRYGTSDLPGYRPCLTCLGRLGVGTRSAAVL
jgi:hypothetical protein